MRQICLSSIISNVTNNKKKLWKTVRLKSFERPIISLLFNFLQLYLSASTSIFAACYSYFLLMLWSFIFMFHSRWRQFVKIFTWHSSKHSSTQYQKSYFFLSQKLQTDCGDKLYPTQAKYAMAAWTTTQLFVIVTNQIWNAKWRPEHATSGWHVQGEVGVRLPLPR